MRLNSGFKSEVFLILFERKRKLFLSDVSDSQVDRRAQLTLRALLEWVSVTQIGDG